MIYRRSSPEPDRTPGWKAWCISLGLHLATLLILCWQSLTPPRHAATETPERIAGIVLTQAEPPGEQVAEAAAAPADTSAAAVETSNPAEQATSSVPDPKPPDPEPPAAEPVVAAPTGSPREQLASDARELLAGGSKPSSVPQNGLAGPAGSGRAAVRAALRGETTTEVFGVEGTGVKFVYLFDRSDSMHGQPLAAVKQQLVASIQSLRSVNQFFIFFFNHQVSAWDGGGARVSFATDGNKRAAAHFVEGISATGGTYRWDALRRALALRPDVIFFLTDTDNQMPELEVEKAIQRAVRAGIVIQSIEFGPGPGGRIDNFLRRLARETGGQYTYVDTTALGK